MELKIIEEKNNPLLRRKTIKLEIENKKETPSRKNILNEAKKLGKGKYIIVKKIKQKTGSNLTEAIINFYESKEKMEEIEAKHILKKHSKEEKNKEKDKEKNK